MRVEFTPVGLLDEFASGLPGYVNFYAVTAEENGQNLGRIGVDWTQWRVDGWGVTEPGEEVIMWQSCARKRC